MGAENPLWPFRQEQQLSLETEEDDDVACLLSEHQQQLEVHAAAAAPAAEHVSAPQTAASVESGQPATRSMMYAPFMQLQGWIWSSGTACILLAAFIFSLSSLAVKLTGGRVPVLEITLIRSFLSFLVSAALIRQRSLPMFGSRDKLPWLLARGIFGATAMILFYASLLLLPIADAMTLFFLNPSITAVVAWAIRGEALGLLGVAGVAVSVLGLVVLTHPPMLFGGHEDWGPRRLGGTACGVAASVAAAGAFISIRFVGKAEPAITVALYFHTCTMGMSVLPLAVGWPQRPVLLGTVDMLLLLVVAVTSFSAQLLLTRGFQLELSAAQASGLNFCQVLYSYLFGILVFSEHLTLFGVLGTLLIALGMLCVTSRRADKTTDEARHIAAAGCGSRLFDRQQQLNSDGSRSGSFLSRMQSLQRLLAAAGGAERCDSTSLPVRAASPAVAAAPAAAGADLQSGRGCLGADTAAAPDNTGSDDRQPLLVVTAHQAGHGPGVLPAAVAAVHHRHHHADPTGRAEGPGCVAEEGHPQHQRHQQELQMREMHQEKQPQPQRASMS